MADYLRDGRNGMRPFESTQTGSFDLYLPFIEKGISLLNDKGRVGFIAPSLWIANEYGKGLRTLVGNGRHLERWIDFKSFQIFHEATTYTALQFFTKRPNQTIRVFAAPKGEISGEAWSGSTHALPYDRQKFGDRWLLLTGDERAIIDKLAMGCKRLDDASHTSSIFVGLQTSADSIYHLTKVGPGRYRCEPEGRAKVAPYEVEIEDALMKPLVSGPEAKRYVEPETSTYLLFPYETDASGSARLLTEPKLQEDYPKAWFYLNSYKTDLRFREAKRDTDGEIERDRNGNPTHAPFDDTQWYRFGRHQNLDKQEVAKLIVAQTVPRMRVALDHRASFYLNNVRVNGIIAANDENPWFLLGILNSTVADFVFRRIAKVKDGGFFEANKQFIAPLPIPPATPEQSEEVARLAQLLQRAHTNRRSTLKRIERRLTQMRSKSRPETWLFPNLRPKRDIGRTAPLRLDREQKREWTEQKYEQELAALYDSITVRLRPSVSLSAGFAAGELSFSVDGISVIDRVFASKDEGEFIVAQWKVLAATFGVTENTSGKKLANALRKLAVADNPAAVSQVIELEHFP